MTANPFSVACIQSAPRFGAFQANLDHMSTLIRDVRADLVVLPELFATGYSFADRAEAMASAESASDSPTIKQLGVWSRDTGGLIVAGFAERDGDKVYNAAAVVGGGSLFGVYRKVHLFGFERECFDKGDAPFRAFDFGGLRVGVMICFDWMFPESARCLALAGAEVIAHPSNLVTPGWCQKAMPVRALENMVATATANRHGSEHRGGRPALTFTGESQICGPWGDEVARAPATGDAVVRAEIDRGDIALKRFPSGNQISRDRRPDIYGRISDNPSPDNDLGT